MNGQLSMVNRISSESSNQKTSPADEWSAQSAQHALDDLFNATLKYKTSEKFHELIQFVRMFRFYSPYNALLVHIQRPGACFVAPAKRWNKKYRRLVKPNANPIVILQPMGPVMFVYDVSDTEAGPDSRPLPIEVEKPFETRYGKIGGEYNRIIENAKRDGIRIHGQKVGSQAAGSIQWVKNRIIPPLLFQVGKDKQGNPDCKQIPVRYELLLNEEHNRESRYATIVHELAHLYCGHLGTTNKKWWPDRLGLSKKLMEFEAESVCYLVCERAGIANPSAEYLSGFITSKEDVPQISLECVMKAAGLIENMGSKKMKLRKD
jgi:hypothetical protein